MSTLQDFLLATSSTQLSVCWEIFSNVLFPRPLLLICATAFVYLLFRMQHGQNHNISSVLLSIRKFYVLKSQDPGVQSGQRSLVRPGLWACSHCPNKRFLSEPSWSENQTVEYEHTLLFSLPLPLSALARPICPHLILSDTHTVELGILSLTQSVSKSLMEGDSLFK